MTWAAKIDEWARWTSERLADKEEIPSPTGWIRDVPWFADFLELLGEDDPPKELHDAFHAATQGADGFAARFVGLDLYHRLAHQNSYPLQDELVDDARKQAADEYRRLVAAVAPRDVPLDFRRLDWEIRVCSPLRMWDRADSLMERLKGSALSANAVGSIRAQHLFLRRYRSTDDGGDEENALDDFIWSCRLISEIKSIEFTNVLLNSLAVREPVTLSDAPSPEVVHSAVERGNWPQLPWLKALMMARPGFELALYDEAITCLDAVLRESTLPQPSRRFVYQALSSAYERQGDLQATQTSLHRWSIEFPDDHEILMKLAQASADGADYEKAYRFLERAVALKPELEQDLATRVSLALGQIAVEKAGTWAELKSAIARNPALEQVTEKIVRAYWTSFGELGERERIEWVAAIYAALLLVDQTATLAPAWLRQAGVTFLTIAEGQLRQNVFLPMRSQVAKDRDLLQRARSIRNQDDPDYPLARYLGSQKGVITLGQMLHVLERARARSQSASGPFGPMLVKHLANSPVLEEIDALKRLSRPRNDAVHELFPVDTQAIHDDARRVIDATVRHRGAGS